MNGNESRARKEKMMKWVFQTLGKDRDWIMPNVHHTLPKYKIFNNYKLPLISYHVDDNIRSALRILCNVCDRVFCENSERRLAGSNFCKNSPPLLFERFRIASMSYSVYQLQVMYNLAIYNAYMDFHGNTCKYFSYIFLITHVLKKSFVLKITNLNPIVFLEPTFGIYE